MTITYDITGTVTSDTDAAKELAQQFVDELDWSPLVTAIMQAHGSGSGGPPLDLPPDVLLAPSFIIEQPTANPPVFHVFLARDAREGDFIRWELSSSSNYSVLESGGVYVLLAADVGQGFARVAAASPLKHGLRWPRIRAERGELVSSYTTAPKITVPVAGVFDPFITIAEQVQSAWLQEDVPEGPVAEWIIHPGAVRVAVANGGFVPAQLDPLLQPTKLPDAGGVLFAKGTAQSLLWPGMGKSYNHHRWWLVIARCDSANNPAVTLQRVFAINADAASPSEQQPHVYFNCAAQNLNSRLYSGSQRVEGGPCSGALSDWNIIVGSRRGWQFQSTVNGVKSPGQSITALSSNNGSSSSRIGMPEGNLADMAIDCILIGSGELTDDLIDKLTGWAAHRVGAQSLLPAGHPYSSAPPQADPNDDVPRYRYDEDAWLGLFDSPGYANRYAEMGTPEPAVEGYSTVFLDHFEVNSIADNAADQGAIWFAPSPIGGIIGVNAIAQPPSASPSTYIWDGVSAISLRLLNSNGWKTGAFASVDRNGRGRYWGKGILEIRCKFPTDTTPGYFPAFWSYSREYLIWPTRNRLEFDYFEYDNLDGTYWNATQHVHENDYPDLYVDPTVRKGDGSGTSKIRLISRPISVANGFPFDVNIYDGEYHTWRVRIEDDYTSLSVDGFLVCKVPTVQEFKEPKFILVDWAYRGNTGKGDPTKTYDMTIDYIKVMQKEAELQVVPSAFSALPALTGTFSVGETISCEPNVNASQIEFEWYRDSYPIVSATSSTYQLTADDAGHKIRVHVRAASLYGQPYAWSLESAAVA